jgi:hypothetical protein
VFVRRFGVILRLADPVSHFIPEFKNAKVMPAGNLRKGHI